MKTQTSVIAFIGVLLISLCVAASAGAESVKALSPFQGMGQTFKVQEELAFTVGAWTGLLFVEGGQGVFDSTTMICPGTVEVNLRTDARNGAGRCIISNARGDKAYASWRCSGDRKGCRGPFSFTGGTGRFRGISGESTFVVRIGMRGMQETGSPDAFGQVAVGLVMWPKLEYRIR